MLCVARSRCGGRLVQRLGAGRVLTVTAPREPALAVPASAAASGRAHLGTAAAAAARSALLARKARQHGRSPRVQRRSVEDSGGEGASDDVVDGVSRSLRSALQQFKEEVQKTDEEINLAYAASLLAQHADPSLDPEAAVLKPLALLGEEFQSRLQGASDADLPKSLQMYRRAGALCAFLDGKGFAGCSRTEEGYYNADNSRMDKVLQRRRGIPITLSLVYMEVGRAAGLELNALNFPGHLLLRFGDSESAGMVDAFTNQVFSESEACAYLSSLYNQPVRLDASWRTSPQLPKIIFLLRMVRNLQNVYDRDNNVSQAVQVMQYAQCLEAVAGMSG